MIQKNLSVCDIYIIFKFSFSSMVLYTRETERKI